MIEFDGWRVPTDFSNDGCTCAPDRLFGVNLRPACEMHDFHSRYLVHDKCMSVQTSDWIFRRHLIYLGLPAIVARMYWIVVKLVRPWRNDRAPLPPEWAEYAKQLMTNLESKEEDI